LPPSRLQPKVPRDLETICLRCLEKEPGRRYASAGDLAKDLGRFLAGEPIRARRTPWWEHAVKWAKRKPAQAALLVVSIAAAAGRLAVWAAFTAELKAERDRARYHEEKAREQAGIAQENHRAAERGWAIARQERDAAQEQRERAEAILHRCLEAVDGHVQ